MYRLILIFLIVISWSDSVLSQNIKNDSLELDGTKYVIFHPSSKLNSQIKIGLRTRYTLIKLRVHPKINLDEEQYKTYLKLIDTIQNIKNVSIIDSVSISLKSGISWNLIGEPPPQPKNLYIRVFRKKYREDKAVLDRLKYLQFCHAWMENNALPQEMVDKFNSYFAIIIDGVKQFEMSFEIKYNENRGTKTTNKEIIFNTK